MAKAMLIMEKMPKHCFECPCVDSLNDMCKKEVKHISRIDAIMKEEKPEWCPLREAPKKIVYTEGLSQSKLSEVKGYNACIDEILGGTE